MEDLYAVMGVDADASPEEIRAAYRSLAQRFHPDHNPNNMAAARRMQEINEAFAVLNSPERRRAYGEARQRQMPAPQQTPAHGAGRGQRPYYRGNNWGLHTGAEEPPAYIVRAIPGGFNLAVTVAGEPPAREVTIFNDAPFPVHMRLICSPWLEASAETIAVDGHDNVWLTVAITRAASEELRGWRDGGVSLVTDDPRVFCPDIRVTAIFMAQGPVTAPSATQAADAPGPDADLRTVNGETRRDGWFRRLFGG